MFIIGTTGRADINSDEVLARRLRTQRVGRYGAFILAHTEQGPSLWIHINEDVAYLHYADQPGRLCSLSTWKMTMASSERPPRAKFLTDRKRPMTLN